MNWVPLRSCRRLLKDSPPLPSPPPPSSSGSKISPAVLFVIVILAVIFFISGLIHLLIRFFIKQRPSPPPPSSPNSNGRYRRGLSGSEALQRQLQSLFHLQDSGLDQSVIDALPVFLYSELVGPKEPFDCAVCLCEFADDDRLRLLPVCSHAFHLNCIDTWLLSNSTCPLCRGGLFAPGFGVENPVFESDEPVDEDGMPADCEEPQKTSELDVIGTPNSADDEDKMMLPVRLGKFKSLVVDTNDTGDDHEARVTENAITREEGQSSSSNSSSNRSTCNLDARRCYSMGSYQYVVGDSILKVALSRNWDGRSGRKRCEDLNSGAEEGLTGKRLLMGSKGESFSVSKIWQWTNKKGRLPLASDRASLEGGLPWIKRGAN